MGGPELQLCVARGMELDEVFLATVVHLHARDRLRVAPIERFGEPQNRSERSNRPARLCAECAEVRV